MKDDDHVSAALCEEKVELAATASSGETAGGDEGSEEEKEGAAPFGVSCSFMIFFYSFFSDETCGFQVYVASQFYRIAYIYADT